MCMALCVCVVVVFLHACTERLHCSKERQSLSVFFFFRYPKNMLVKMLWQGISFPSILRHHFFFLTSFFWPVQFHPPPKWNKLLQLCFANWHVHWQVSAADWLMVNCVLPGEWSHGCSRCAQLQNWSMQEREPFLQHTEALEIQTGMQLTLLSHEFVG